MTTTKTMLTLALERARQHGQLEFRDGNLPRGERFTTIALADGDLAHVATSSFFVERDGRIAGPLTLEGRATPFFSRYLEAQPVSAGGPVQTQKFPSDQEETPPKPVHTQKYPSDQEDGGGKPKRVS